MTETGSRTEPQPSPERHESAGPARPRHGLERAWLSTVFGVAMLVAMLGALVIYDRLLDSSDLGPLDGRSPEVNEPAPQFALRDTDGRVRRLSDYEGQVVWVNFWATWCGPCRRELPDIQRLADELEGAGVVVLTVNFKQSADTALPFWDELGLDLPILLDSDGDVARQYDLLGFPDNFFIDREGVLRSFELGFLTEGQMRERLTELGLG